MHMYVNLQAPAGAEIAIANIELPAEGNFDII